MPRYFLPGGKSVFTEKPIPESDMDGFMSSMMGPDANTVKKSETLAPPAPPTLFDKVKDKAKLIGNRMLDIDYGRKVGPDNPLFTPTAKEGSILPTWKSQPENYWGGFAKSIYNDFIQPQGAPSAIIGSASPARLNGAAFNDNVLEAAGKGLPIDPAPVPVSFDKFGPETKPLPVPPKALPPAPRDIELQKTPSFIANEKEVVPNNLPYTGPLARGSAILENQRPNVPMSSTMDTAAIVEQKRIDALRGSAGWNGMTRVGNDITAYDKLPATSGDTTGGFGSQTNANLPYPENIVPNAVRPRTVQSNMLRTVPDRLTQTAADSDGLINDFGPKEPVGQAKNVRPPIGDIREPGTPAYQDKTLPAELPSAKVKLREKKPIVDETPKPKSGDTIPPTESNGTATLNPEGNKPITGDLKPREAVERWAWGRRGAKTRADFKKQEFSDLSDPALIDAYERGDRTGRLADVESYFNQRHEQGVKAGLLKEDQKRLNYLRHEFQNSDDEISAALNTHFAKNPSLAKEGKFPTYAAAEEAGLTRKFESIPDIVKAYEQKFHEALKNKEMYDYLINTKQMSPKTLLSTHPREWAFLGENKAELKKLVGNVFSESPENLKKVADLASSSKNIYLSGGIPGTKYNMHTWNIYRSDIKQAGFVKATKELLTDPTGKKAEAVFKQYKDLVPDLVDHGYVFHPIEDSTAQMAKEGSRFLNNPIVKGYQNAFEKPLFEHSLPALKLKRTAEVLNDLMAKGMPREEALRQASKIGNEFYGGVNKALRNKVYTDSARIVFLAPDWLESRLRVALGDFKGAAKVIAGKGTAVDKIYAKSAARGAAIGAGTLGLSAYEGRDILKGKPGDALTIDMGKDAKGKTRELQTVGTADEGVRSLVEPLIKLYQGNPAGLIESLIYNKFSTPFRAGMNVISGKDDFGESLRGKDKYGKDIPLGSSIVKHLYELSRPVQLQAIQYALRYVTGKSSGEEALSGGLEFPLKYSNPPKDKNAMSIRLK